MTTRSTLSFQMSKARVERNFHGANSFGGSWRRTSIKVASSALACFQGLSSAGVGRILACLWWVGLPPLSAATLAARAGSEIEPLHSCTMTRASIPRRRRTLLSIAMSDLLGLVLRDPLLNGTDVQERVLRVLSSAICHVEVGELLSERFEVGKDVADVCRRGSCRQGRHDEELETLLVRDLAPPALEDVFHPWEEMDR